MSDKNQFDRREFVKTTFAVGTAISVAGCGSITELVGSNKTGADVESTAISYGDSADGELTSSSPSEPQYGDPAEAFTFDGSAGDVVIVTMRSSAFDTYMLLGGPGGDIFQENDDGRTGTDSRMARALPTDGTYTIWASSLSGDGTGSFTVSLSEGSQSDLVPENATAISYGDTVEGQLTMDAPLDPFFSDPGVPYRLEGSEGDSVTVTMDSTEIDSYLVCTDEHGELVAKNDDGGADRNSQLSTTLPADGRYIIWAESALGDESGRFTLSLSGP